MGILINAYCTHRHPPELDFQHQLNARRDRSDPELVDHLNGFIGFVLGGGQREMTQSLYHIVRHLQRVRHHVSLTVEREHLAEFQRWAQEANAVLFLGDSTVRDPRGKVLVDPATGEPHEGATVPYPADALARRERSGEMLQQMGAPEPTALPPVAGEDEAELRDPVEVAHRALALIVAAVYGESLATDDAIPVEAFKDRNPIGVASLSPVERAFLEHPSPDQQSVVNHTWRYEALFVLEWALGLIDDLPMPDRLCDVGLTAKLLLEPGEESIVRNATLRPAGEILDALDLHIRLHWLVRQAGLDNTDPPANLEPGVVAERHYALNWLTCFEDMAWDDVDTPT